MWKSASPARQNDTYINRSNYFFYYYYTYVENFQNFENPAIRFSRKNMAQGK